MANVRLYADYKNVTSYSVIKDTVVANDTWRSTGNAPPRTIKKEGQVGCGESKKKV